MFKVVQSCSQKGICEPTDSYFYPETDIASHESLCQWERARSINELIKWRGLLSGPHVEGPLKWTTRENELIFTGGPLKWTARKNIILLYRFFFSPPLALSFPSHSLQIFHLLKVINSVRSTRNSGLYSGSKPLR